jgi:U4/U6.U5 tri-snRNP-associated protein 2
MKRGREWEKEVYQEAIESKEDDGRGVVEGEVGFVTQGKPKAQLKCPYLDTVCRRVIDFDSEKLCSQTLCNRNVYVCLICGKFFEGRGKHTPAYTHSLQFNHYVYMNLESGRSYCLPDSYEILDRSLSDVQRCLSPSFSLKEIGNLDQNAAVVRDMHSTTYLPGFVGLNNLNCTDDINVVLHLLSHVAPFRDFFLQSHLFSVTQSKLVQEFGLVCFCFCFVL